MSRGTSYTFEGGGTFAHRQECTSSYPDDLLINFNLMIILHGTKSERECCHDHSECGIMFTVCKKSFNDGFSKLAGARLFTSELCMSTPY